MDENIGLNSSKCAGWQPYLRQGKPVLRLIFGDDPIIRREIDLPEAGRGFDEFDSDLRFAALRIADVDGAAIETVARQLVRQRERLAGAQRRIQRQQGAMRIDHQRAGLFLEFFAIGQSTLYQHGHTEQYARAAALLLFGNQATCGG